MMTAFGARILRGAKRRGAKGAVIAALTAAGLLMVPPAATAADDLFGRGSFPSLAADLRASEPGDVLTVVIFQSAEARGSARQVSSKRGRYAGRFGYDGALDPNPIGEGYELELGGSYAGTGEVARRQSFFAEISVVVTGVLPNGNLVIEGGQSLRINGEDTEIAVRGIVRPVDIEADNKVLSTRIAQAEIDYDGSGFVTRSTRPGVINWLFSVLGLG